jgi:hypothetical protein
VLSRAPRIAPRLLHVQDFWSPRLTVGDDVEARLATTQSQLALVLCSHLELLTTVTSQAAHAIASVQQRGGAADCSQSGTLDVVSAPLRVSKSNSYLAVCSSRRWRRDPMSTRGHTPLGPSQSQHMRMRRRTIQTTLSACLGSLRAVLAS